MLQWLKRSLASFLGDKKDIVKNLPIIKKLNDKGVELEVRMIPDDSKQNIMTLI